MKRQFERMLRGMAWADQTILEALKISPAAQDEALPILAHLLAAEEIWLCRLEGRAAELPVHPTLALEECETLAFRNAASYDKYVERLREADFETTVCYRNTRGEGFATPVADVLLHVFSHGAYHRGQIAKSLGRCGGPSVNTDYISFVRGGDAALLPP